MAYGHRVGRGAINKNHLSGVAGRTPDGGNSAGDQLCFRSYNVDVSDGLSRDDERSIEIKTTGLTFLTGLAGVARFAAVAVILATAICS